MEQHADEFVGRVALGRAALVEAEDLLELIDDEQEVRAGRELRLAERLDEAEMAARERGEQAGLGVFFGLADLGNGDLLDGPDPMGQRRRFNFKARSRPGPVKLQPEMKLMPCHCNE